MITSSVKLFDGTVVDLNNLPDNELLSLHYSQETRFAKAILAAPPFSKERASIVERGYALVHHLVAYRCERTGQPFLLSMGEFGSKVAVRVTEHLAQAQAGQGLSFFEAGFGPGVVLGAVAKLDGVAVSGCDVDISNCSNSHATHLYKGNAFDSLAKLPDSSVDVFYWSDVFEHIPPDEIREHVRLIHRKLRDKGYAITITPNWHLRPTDITRRVHPLGTEALGFHLKEYTYRELSRLFLELGFRKVLSPYCYIPKTKDVVMGFGLTAAMWHQCKFLMEPVAAVIPYPFKPYFIQLFGYHTIVGQK